MLEFNKVIREDLESSSIIDVVSNGVNTVACPVGLYMDASGVITGIKVALDSNSMPGRFGIAMETAADGETFKVKIKGEATVTSGGTAGQLVTAVSNAGAITDAAPANTNADTNTLGVSTSATTFIIG